MMDSFRFKEHMLSPAKTDPLCTEFYRLSCITRRIGIQAPIDVRNWSAQFMIRAKSPPILAGAVLRSPR